MLGAAAVAVFAVMSFFVVTSALGGDDSDNVTVIEGATPTAIPTVEADPTVDARVPLAEGGDGDDAADRNDGDRDDGQSGDEESSELQALTPTPTASPTATPEVLGAIATPGVEQAFTPEEPAAGGSPTGAGESGSSGAGSTASGTDAGESSSPEPPATATPTPQATPTPEPTPLPTPLGLLDQPTPTATATPAFVATPTPAPTRPPPSPTPTQVATVAPVPTASPLPTAIPITECNPELPTLPDGGCCPWPIFFGADGVPQCVEPAVVPPTAPTATPVPAPAAQCAPGETPMPADFPFPCCPADWNPGPVYEEGVLIDCVDLIDPVAVTNP